MYGEGHLLAGTATAEGFRRAISGFARSDPLQPHNSLTGPIVQGAPGLFGPLFVFGMLAAGLGIVFGVLTPVAPAGVVRLCLTIC